jgi:hypothetical protein
MNMQMRTRIYDNSYSCWGGAQTAGGRHLQKNIRGSCRNSPTLSVVCLADLTRRVKTYDDCVLPSSILLFYALRSVSFIAHFYCLPHSGNCFVIGVPLSVIKTSRWAKLIHCHLWCTKEHEEVYFLSGWSVCRPVTWWVAFSHPDCVTSELESTSISRILQKGWNSLTYYALTDSAHYITFILRNSQKSRHPSTAYCIFFFIEVVVYIQNASVLDRSSLSRLQSKQSGWEGYAWRGC